MAWPTRDRIQSQQASRTQRRATASHIHTRATCWHGREFVVSEWKCCHVRYAHPPSELRDEEAVCCAVSKIANVTSLWDARPPSCLLHWAHRRQHVIIVDFKVARHASAIWYSWLAARCRAVAKPAGDDKRPIQSPLGSTRAVEVARAIWSVHAEHRCLSSWAASLALSSSVMGV